jgi:hypothetical protein
MQINDLDKLQKNQQHKFEFKKDQQLVKDFKPAKKKSKMDINETVC